MFKEKQYKTLHEDLEIVRVLYHQNGITCYRVFDRTRQKFLNLKFFTEEAQKFAENNLSVLKHGNLTHGFPKLISSLSGLLGREVLEEGLESNLEDFLFKVSHLRPSTVQICNLITNMLNLL